MTVKEWNADKGSASALNVANFAAMGAKLFACISEAASEGMPVEAAHFGAAMAYAATLATMAGIKREDAYDAYLAVDAYLPLLGEFAARLAEEGE